MLAPLLLAILSTASAEAPVDVTAPAAPAVEPAVDATPKTEFSASGLYTIWGLTQRNFLLGADHPLNDGGYTVHMLRTKVEVKRPQYGVVARFDAGQGWWGVNNSPNTEDLTVVDEHGDVESARVYNRDGLFSNKDTNYGLHVDLAYAWADFDGLPVPVRVQAGRQYYGVGNRLVLDQVYEGVSVTATPHDDVAVELMWAKVSEGLGSFTLPSGALMSDAGQNSDADLLLLRADWERDAVHAELYGLYYVDTISDDYSHLPMGLGYARSRFTPNITRLAVVGLAADGTFDLIDGLTWKAEGAWLSGEDGVPNTDHAGGLLDINDGRLSGYIAYAELTQAFTVGVPADVGLVFGLGSGDPDPTGGRGNVTRLQTMGTFPFTNVWEDSVMPDVEGISPQGLGSPVSRGYRELENTTAVMARVGVKPIEQLRLEVAGAYVRATQPVFAFDAAGTPTGAGARDLGVELDANARIAFKNGITFDALFGYFIPGTAAGYLINGSDASLEPAWELKNVATAKF